MSLRVTEVVMDCADHGAVVDFWAAALGYERRAVNDQYVALAPPSPAEPGRPPILFQKVPESKIVKAVNATFDLRPYGIVKMLDLLKPIYKATASYGHFGREDQAFSWERTVLAETLRDAAGLRGMESVV